jgi:hypothetical protein
MREGGGYDVVPGGSPFATPAKPQKKGLFSVFRRG